MKITKIGHCCLLIETKAKRIVTDPGSYTAAAHSELKDIDAALFTHEHQDHFHLESLKDLLKNNPNAVVYANDSVHEILNKEGVANTLVKNGETTMIGQIEICGIGEKHAEIHRSIPLFANRGFFIDGKLWYPGDSFVMPGREVEILALPTSGPWMKMSEAIDYAVAIKPKVAAFPVHDFGKSTFNPMIEKILGNFGVKFVSMVDGESKEW